MLSHPHRGAPLCEARTRLVELLGTLLQVVQAPAPSLALPAADQWHETRVDLDARDDPVLLCQVHHLLAVGRVLVERLGEQDGTTAEVAEALGSQQRLAPALPVRLRVFHADRREAIAARAVRLVHRENALPGDVRADTVARSS